MTKIADIKTLKYGNRTGNEDNTGQYFLRQYICKVFSKVVDFFELHI